MGSSASRTTTPEPSGTTRTRKIDPNCRACRDDSSDSSGEAKKHQVDGSGSDAAVLDADAVAAAAARKDLRVVAYMHSGCPLNRREVGRAAWAYLHTTAAYYPQDPTPQEQANMRQFMKLMAQFYPCGYCADMTRDELIRNPPRVKSQRELSTWLCEIHNEVNDRLGKPIFDCSKVTERWKTGPSDGSCE